MQHVRIAKYRVQSGTLAEISDAAREGMLEVFKEQPGFVSYGVADSGDETLLSISHWETHDEAEKAAVVASEWVAANLDGRIGLLENNTGDYLFLG
jgi:heme-degrading monooxygenase HmoA